MVSSNHSDTVISKHLDSFAVNVPLNAHLSATTPLKGTVAFNSKGSRGRFHDRLELTFYDTVTKKEFVILKPLFIIVGNRDDYENLKSSAPYVPAKRKPREPMKDVTEGDPPPAFNAVKWVVRLPAYDYPIALRTILDTSSMKDKIGRLRPTFVPEMLSSATHARWFHTMLHIEEHQST